MTACWTAKTNECSLQNNYIDKLLELYNVHVNEKPQVLSKTVAIWEKYSENQDPRVSFGNRDKTTVQSMGVIREWCRTEGQL